MARANRHFSFQSRIRHPHACGIKASLDDIPSVIHQAARFVQRPVRKPDGQRDRSGASGPNRRTCRCCVTREPLPELIEGCGVTVWVVPRLVGHQEGVLSDPTRVRAAARDGHDLGQPCSPGRNEPIQRDSLRFLLQGPRLTSSLRFEPSQGPGLIRFREGFATKVVAPDGPIIVCGSPARSGDPSVVSNNCSNSAESPIKLAW